MLLQERQNRAEQSGQVVSLLNTPDKTKTPVFANEDNTEVEVKTKTASSSTVITSLPTGLDVPTDGERGSRAFTQCLSASSSKKRKLLDADSSRTATIFDTATTGPVRGPAVGGIISNSSATLVNTTPTTITYVFTPATNLMDLMNYLTQHMTSHASLKLKDYHKFQLNPHGGSCGVALVNANNTNSPQFNFITSLNFCSSTTTIPYDRYEDSVLLKTLPPLLPEILDVNFTNTSAGSTIIAGFFENCLKLEKFTFHNQTELSFDNSAQHISCNPIGLSFDDLRPNIPRIPSDGAMMKAGTNLKKIDVDGSWLFIDEEDVAKMSNYLGSEKYLFHKCSSEILERVSLRNTKLYVRGLGDNGIVDRIIEIPQEVLMKFIHEAPATLRWF